jgi:hypothetical protein
MKTKTTKQNKTNKENTMSKNKQTATAKQMPETKIRLENDKRLWIVNLKGAEYTIVSGSLSGTAKREGHKVLTAREKWTVEQEALNKVARMVKSKIKHGFVAKDKAGNDKMAEVEKFLASVKLELVSTDNVERIKKQYAKAEAAYQKAKANADKKEAKMKDIKAKMDAVTVTA